MHQTEIQETAGLKYLQSSVHHGLVFLSVEEKKTTLKAKKNHYYISLVWTTAVNKITAQQAAIKLNFPHLTPTLYIEVNQPQHGD